MLIVSTPLRADWPPAPPAVITLSAPDASGIARAGDMARGGVPLPRSAGIVDPSRLRLLDAAGVALPAQFRVLARWNAPRDQLSAPVQWVLIDGPAPAPGTSLRLQTDAPPGNSPLPATALTVTQASGRYTIDTGAARFVIDPAGGALFAEVRAADGSLLGTGERFSVGLNGNVYQTSEVRFVRIDAQGPLAATLTVAWLTNAPTIGGGRVSLRRQYEFAAGSPTALVRSALAWEGERCGNSEFLSCAAGVNGLQLTSARDALQPAGAGARTVQVLAEAGAATDVAALAPGATAHLRQLRRSARTQAQAYELAIPGVTRQGLRANGGALALSTAGSGALGIALTRMDQHEPQALRVLANGSVALDWIDTPGIWVGSRQAVFATTAVAALPVALDAVILNRRLWAPLAHPLRLWATPAQFAASEAVPEFPVGPLPAAYAGFDPLVERMLTTTRSRFDSLGLRGLMTTGLWPSYWGTPNDPPPDCGANDPTPADDWDDPYWCASWTDHHNAATVGALAAFRAGDPAWFDAISVPAAQRMLHTQIMQCAPDDPWFYCAQAPSGGGGYRSNFNSSHAYFENLILYHFLTGDPWVVDTLVRGAPTMRAYLCGTRAGSPPGPMCAPTTPGPNDFVQFNDRAASQWFEVFRFLGQTVDGSYLDDWRGNIARWLSLFWAQGTDAQGRRLGFIVQSGVGNGLSILAPGGYTTSQLWMASAYDFEQLARLRVATQDSPLGSPALAPSTVIGDWGRTLWRTASLAPGNGTAAGIWPNTLDFEWSGARLGGTISGVAPGWAPGEMPAPCFDNCLYDTGKAFMTAAIARAADFTADPALRALADDYVRHAIVRAATADVSLGKEGGEYLVRLPSAVARLSTTNLAPPLFANGFEPAN